MDPEAPVTPAELEPTDQGRVAARFLASFRAASREGDNPLAAISEDPEGFSAAIAVATDELGEALEADVVVAPIGPAFVRGGAFASAACDASGRVIVADAAFTAWVDLRSHMRAALHQFSATRPAISFLIEDRGKFIAVAAAPSAHARHWPLSPEVAAALLAGQATIAVIARLDRPVRGNGPAAAARALGFTGLEARVVESLVRAGDARGAASLAGVTYETAREALGTAMKKAGVRSQTALVALVLRLDSGESSPPPSARVIRDMFGLTERQVQVALAIPAGLSRAEVAAATGLSAHVVKAELAVLYDRMGVNTMAALSRALGQISALTALAEASSVDLMSAQQEAEPLRLLPRSNRNGRIAFADHGPSNGLPTLILHTATTGRHLPLSHVEALQALGLRPIALDRPGTGLTDMCEGPLLDESAQDLVNILDALNIEKGSIIARGGAMVLSRFAARYPRRLNRAVVLNPEPRPADDTSFIGFFGRGKRLIFNHPALIGMLSRHLASRSASRTLATLVRRALASSPADMATLADPAFLSAYVRSTQQSALQNGVGFRAIASTEPFEAETQISDGSHITILYGAEDPLYARQDSEARWTRIWPGCRVEVVEGAGRLMQFQRPDRVAAALTETSP